MAMIIKEPAKDIPVFYEADICVLGGSCTGVFAAVRAARLGAKVVIVEKQNAFGGVATSGLVNIWHSLYNTEFSKQIIAGLTLETVERLQRVGAVKEEKKSHSVGYVLNTEELKIELDNLIVESGVKAYLHTMFVAPHVEDGVLKAVIVENKSGRGAILAKSFIDATGDGDLAARLELDYRISSHFQPSTTSVNEDSMPAAIDKMVTYMTAAAILGITTKSGICNIQTVSRTAGNTGPVTAR